jgi:hypothetical protein
MTAWMPSSTLLSNSHSVRRGSVMDVG